MKIEWTTLSLTDLQNILAYISEDNPVAAARVITAIRAAIRGQLFESPFGGRAGRVKGTRELVVPRLPYIVAYRVTDTSVQILRTLHSREEWPRRFGKSN